MFLRENVVIIKFNVITLMTIPLFYAQWTNHKDQLKEHTHFEVENINT